MQKKAMPSIPNITIVPSEITFQADSSEKCKREQSNWRAKLELGPEQPHTLRRCWSEASTTQFMIRGKHYLQDGIKVPSEIPICELLWWDLFTIERQQDPMHISQHPSSFIQHAISKLGAELPQLFVVTILVPGTPEISSTKYFAPRVHNDANLGLSEGQKLWKAFLKGDDKFRNERLKIIPIVNEGPWIVKKAVGSNPFLIAKALKVTWHRTAQYLEAVIDISSDKVAKHITSLCRRNLSSLIIDFGFVIEGKEAVELPEALLASIRLKHVDFRNAVPIHSINKVV